MSENRYLELTSPKPDNTEGAQSLNGRGTKGTAHTNASHENELHENSHLAKSNGATSSQLDTTASKPLPTFGANYYDNGHFVTNDPNETRRDDKSRYLYNQGLPSAGADFDVTTNEETGERHIRAFVHGEKLAYKNGRPVIERMTFESWIGRPDQAPSRVRVIPTGSTSEVWLVGGERQKVMLPGVDTMVEGWEGPTVVSLPIIQGTASRLLAKPASVTSED